MCIRDTINRIYALRNFPHSTTKCVRTICNNITFKNQKPYFCNAKTPFCTPKTILLHGKNHTFVLRTRNVHRMNTLRTLHKISTFTHENTQRTICNTQYSKNKNYIFIFPKMQCHYTIAQKQHTTAHYI